MFAQLERMAGPDVKHGDRLRLENYTLLETELPALANKVDPCGTPCTSLMCILSDCIITEVPWTAACPCCALLRAHHLTAPVDKF